MRPERDLLAWRAELVFQRKQNVRGPRVWRCLPLRGVQAIWFLRA